MNPKYFTEERRLPKNLKYIKVGNKVECYYDDRYECSIYIDEKKLIEKIKFNEKWCNPNSIYNQNVNLICVGFLTLIKRMENLLLVDSIENIPPEILRMIIKNMLIK